MYLCRRCEVSWSQSPLEARECEAKRLAAAAAAPFPTGLEKFAGHVDELTRSSASPSQRLGAGGPGAVAAPRRPPRARPRRPRPPAPGGARHVLPTVWIPLFLRTPGKGASRGCGGCGVTHWWVGGCPATRCRFLESRACAARSVHWAPRRLGALRASVLRGGGRVSPAFFDPQHAPTPGSEASLSERNPGTQERCGTGGRARPWNPPTHTHTQTPREGCERSGGWPGWAPSLQRRPGQADSQH